jgi:phosphorylcholine metabolism protein LicD
MPRDTEFASEERINASIEKLRANNIPYKTYTIEPITLTPKTFHERIPTITKEASSYVFYRLQQNKWLDSQNELIYNPRRRDTWKTFLFTSSNKTQNIQSILNNLEENKNIIPDFLNTIYGEHEISFERSFEALQWLQELYLEKTKPAAA